MKETKPIMDTAQDDDIYDVGPTSAETVTDIKTLKQRFEQKPIVQMKSRPLTKPKPTSDNGKMPSLPPKENNPPPLTPKSAITLNKNKTPPPTAPKKNVKNVTILHKRVSTGKKPVPNQNHAQKVKDAPTVVGIDGKIYQRLPKPTTGNSGVIPKTPVRPPHLMLPEYAASDKQAEDDDDLYDDIGVPTNTNGSGPVRPISMIPDMTEEDELGRKATEIDYDPEDYDDICQNGDSGDDDIYESFPDEENN